MILFKTFLVFIIFSISLCISRPNSQKYQNLAPSLVYQLICNGTESRVISKTKAILSFAEESVENLIKTQKTRSEEIIKDCESKYWNIKCNETGIWQEEIEELQLKIRYINRNISEINDTLAEMRNETEYLDKMFVEKMNETETKLSQSEADLDLIEQVEKLIQEDLLTKNNATSFLETHAKILKETIKLHSQKNIIKGDEIGEEILGILREIKQKLLKEIKSLKFSLQTYENSRKEKMFEMNRETVKDEEKVQELNTLLEETQNKMDRLQAKIKVCEKISGEKDELCLKIQNNATIFLDSLQQDFDFLDQVYNLLK